MNYSQGEYYGERRNDAESEVRHRSDRTRPDGDNLDHSNEGVYKELERLRSLVDVIEGDRRPSRGGVGSSSSCFPVALDNSMMSTVFGLVFVTIITVTIYAFHNLYRAIVKRFFEQHEPL